MSDLGPPVSYMAIERGTPVYSASGEHIGTVDHVLADARVDVFDGLIVDARPLLGSHRFADADQIDGLFERGVTLNCSRDALHEPSENAAAMSVGPDDTAAGGLSDRLRRAWDWISGRY